MTWKGIEPQLLIIKPQKSGLQTILEIPINDFYS